MNTGQAFSLLHLNNDFTLGIRLRPHTVSCERITPHSLSVGPLGSSVSEPNTSQDERLPLKYIATKPITAKNAVTPIAYAQDCPIR